MIVNYDELHKIVAPIIAALPDVLFLLEQINAASGTWHAAIDLMTALLLATTKKVQKQLSFSSCARDNCMRL